MLPADSNVPGGPAKTRLPLSAVCKTRRAEIPKRSGLGALNRKANRSTLLFLPSMTNYLSFLLENESNRTMRKGKKDSAIFVGTASWSDPGFVERWYPKKMPAGERLAWYSQHFEMVEVNSSFYSVPDPRLTERWCHNTPDGFVFDVKLHQLLSRHSANAKLLPPALQRKAEVDAKG